MEQQRHYFVLRKKLGRKDGNEGEAGQGKLLARQGRIRLKWGGGMGKGKIFFEHLNGAGQVAKLMELNTTGRQPTSGRTHRWFSSLVWWPTTAEIRVATGCFQNSQLWPLSDDFRRVTPPPFDSSRREDHGGGITSPFRRPRWPEITPPSAAFQRPFRRLRRVSSPLNTFIDHLIKYISR
ncbi:hypothetical protein RND71_012278 [Anisodus tanguticus]|uniref:Uncharacterized protein n=1 Tax=Anisodus tanguticus TaxID=243964 RepID=A0AAE1VLM6_9SOLA|nr:hypothetical protein RND71_012278 [Anisodus tanguticus]